MATMAPRHGLILLAFVFVCLFGFAGAMNPTPEHDNGHGEIQITEHEIDAYVEGNTVDVDSAHRKGLPHRGVWAVVIDGKKRVVLIRRGKDTVTCPGTWSICLLYTSPSPRDVEESRMPSSA